MSVEINRPVEVSNTITIFNKRGHVDGLKFRGLDIYEREDTYGGGVHRVASCGSRSSSVFIGLYHLFTV